MTTLAEVATLVQSGNKEQERTTDTLERVEKGFNKFFDQQERDRLDRLEDRLDAQRARRAGAAGAAGAGAAAGFAAATSQAAKGAFDGLKDLALFLANPLGWARALLGGVLRGAGFVTAAAVGGSYKALKNVLDDRLKTQRGILRIEAAELKAKEAEVKKAAQRQKMLAQQEANDAKRIAKARIRAAELQYKESMKAATDADLKRFARAERAAEMNRIRVELERARAEAAAAKERQRLIKEQAKALRKAATSGNKIQLADVIADTDAAYKAILTRDGKVNTSTPGKPFLPSNVPVLNSGIASAALPPEPTISRAPSLMSDGPTQPDAAQTKAMTNAEQLAKYSNADLERVGVYRSLESGGRIAYKDLVNNRYVNQGSLLADLQSRANARPSYDRPNAMNERGRGPIGSGYSMGALRVGSAYIDPIGSAVQESLEAGARKYGSASGYKGAMGKAFGTAARILGSVPFNTALLTLSPTMLADATITGPLQGFHENLIAAVLTGKYQNVADALTAYDNYINAIGVDMDMLTPEQRDLYLYLKSLSPNNNVTQDLKTFVNMQYAKFHGKVNRGPEGGGKGTRTVYAQVSSGQYKGSPTHIMSGMEISALDAMEMDRARMGLGGQSNIGHIGDNNTNNVSNSVHIGQEGPGPNDYLNGGSNTAYSVVGSNP